MKKRFQIQIYIYRFVVYFICKERKNIQNVEVHKTASVAAVSISQLTNYELLISKSGGKAIRLQMDAASGDKSSCVIFEDSAIHKEFALERSSDCCSGPLFKGVLQAELDSVSYNRFVQFPKQVRLRIWSCLDPGDLESIANAYPIFQDEIQELRVENCTAPFFRFMHVRDVPRKVEMIPFTLCHYLDARAMKTLRLVCKDLKQIVDAMDESSKQRSRWFWLSDLVEMDSFDFNGQLTIFDIHTQDMKRVMSYLSETDLFSLGMVCRSFRRLVKETKKHPFTENRKTGNGSELSLMDLPSEVLQNILNLCHSNDRANLRLVSRLMQYEVDTNAGVTVYLNDIKFVWSSFHDRTIPPAQSLIVTNVENIHSVEIFTTGYNCSLLTRLLLDGPFPAKAMILILENCKNLRYIGFTYALQMSSLEDDLRRSFPVRKIPLELNSLKALNLKVREADMPSNNIFRVHAWSWANAFEFLRPGLFSIPKLTSFYICEESIFSHKLMYDVAEKILRFLVAHRETLKYVSVILVGNCFRECNCPIYTPEASDEELKEMQLLKFSHDCDWRISRPFTTILIAQTTLCELSCFKVLDWEFYASVISQNQMTLRSVKIEKYMTPVIDLSVFASCRNLEHLFISQCDSTKIGHQNAYHVVPRVLRSSLKYEPRLIRMDKLPKSLRSLHILDQTAETKQIRSIPARLKNLEVLEIQFLGSWYGKGYGLSGKVISEILHLRRLKRLFLEEIRPVGDAHLGHPIYELITKISDLSLSQVSLNFECVLSGILIDEEMPSSQHMPEWTARVSRYSQRGSGGNCKAAAIASDDYYEQVIYEMDSNMFFEDEDDLDELYSCDSDDDGDENSEGANYLL